jgi:hypothetical protein
MKRYGRRPKGPASLADIDPDRVRRALFKADGNVTKAAKALKVNSADLRRLTWARPQLECAPRGGQFQAAGLTGCWAC